MKTITLFAAIFCNLPVFANPVNNEPVITIAETTITSSFSFVRGHKQGKNTTVTWGMTNNSGIDHFIVERTYEDPNDPYSVWQSVGLIPCTHMPIFKLVDNPVLPGTLTYRITAVMNNNSTVVSPFYTAYIQ